MKFGFYESKYRNIIPNPVYDNAAKIIGKPFLKMARNLDIHFDEIFPGTFLESKEFIKNGIDARQFKLKVFHRNKPLCLLSLTFPHLHDKLEFPSPPQLKIEKIY